MEEELDSLVEIEHEHTNALNRLYVLELAKMLDSDPDFIDALNATCEMIGVDSAELNQIWFF